jgi:hypothetical protein
MFEHLKIVALCVVASVVYGILHDQITVRVCVEYFTMFHPPIFQTRSLTMLTIGWGVIATWWVGLPLRLLLSLAARSGPRPPLPASALIRPVGQLLLFMSTCTLLAGILGFFLASQGFFEDQEWIAPVLSSSWYPRFVADAAGLLGGIMLCNPQFRREQH